MSANSSIEYDFMAVPKISSINSNVGSPAGFFSYISK